ncbi:MAG: hypothetical protein ACOC5T_10405 [Elusimicrobiota bacterium]
MKKPQLDLQKWQKLFENPPKKFNSDYGEITFRREFVQSLLIDIKDLAHNGFDNLDICYRGEGRGKSKFTAQKEYARYCLMKELGLINWEWKLEEVIYITLFDFMRALIKYMDEPYRILILDEADELKKVNWAKPLVKSVISYLRRGRKFFKCLTFNLPNLKDLPEDIITDRATKLYELQMQRDFVDFTFIRGHSKMFEIPRADACWSFVHQTTLQEEKVKDTIANLHKDKNKSFIVLPNKIKCLDINFNNVFPFDEKEYENLSIEKNSDYFYNAMSQGFSENEIKVLNMIFEYLASQKAIKKIFGEDENARRAYYRLKDNVNKMNV